MVLRTAAFASLSLIASLSFADERKDFKDLPLQVVSTNAFGTSEGWTLLAGAELGYEASFHGSKDYEFGVMPSVDVAYQTGDWRFYSQLTDWGTQYRFSDNLIVAAALSFEPGRAEDDHEALKGLGDTDDSIELYLDATYFLTDQLSITGRFLKDVGGAKKGHVGFAALNYRLIDNNKWIVDLTADASIADSTHMNAEFGINSTQANNSIYSEYNVGSGLKSYGLSLNSAYKVNDQLALTFGAGFEKYSSAISDSPLIAVNGSGHELEVEAGFTYKF